MKGRPIKTRPHVRIQVHMTHDEAMALYVAAAKAGRSRKNFCEHVLRQELRK